MKFDLVIIQIRMFWKLQVTMSANISNLIKRCCCGWMINTLEDGIIVVSRNSVVLSNRNDTKWRNPTRVRWQKQWRCQWWHQDQEQVLRFHMKMHTRYPSRLPNDNCSTLNTKHIELPHNSHNSNKNSSSSIQIQTLHGWANGCLPPQELTNLPPQTSLESILAQRELEPSTHHEQVWLNCRHAVQLLRGGHTSTWGQDSNRQESQVAKAGPVGLPSTHRSSHHFCFYSRSNLLPHNFPPKHTSYNYW